MTCAIVPCQSSLNTITIVDLYNVEVQAGVSFLPENILPLAQTLLLTISGVFSTSGVLSVVITRDGIEIPLALNSGIVLQAGCLYSFSHPVSDSEQINYKYSGTCTAGVFKVQASIMQEGGTIIGSSSNMYDVMSTAVMGMMVATLGMVMIRSMKG